MFLDRKYRWRSYIQQVQTQMLINFRIYVYRAPITFIFFFDTNWKPWLKGTSYQCSQPAICFFAYTVHCKKPCRLCLLQKNYTNVNSGADWSCVIICSFQLGHDVSIRFYQQFAWPHIFRYGNMNKRSLVRQQNYLNNWEEAKYEKSHVLISTNQIQWQKMIT